jgi:hypothetical protein
LTFNSVFRIFKPSEREPLSNLGKEGKGRDGFVTIEKDLVKLKVMEIIFAKKKDTDEIK